MMQIRDCVICYLLEYGVVSAAAVTRTEHNSSVLSSKRFLLRIHKIEKMAEVLIKLILLCL